MYTHEFVIVTSIIVVSLLALGIVSYKVFRFFKKRLDDISRENLYIMQRQHWKD